MLQPSESISIAFAILFLCWSCVDAGCAAETNEIELVNRVIRQKSKHDQSLIIKIRLCHDAQYSAQQASRLWPALAESRADPEHDVVARIDSFQEK